ncbi:MAG TPA: NADH-quinone oxidoreductase subunit C [Bdellovibrionota bacterium]|nr:NADH-quinone oxidoreductase subunit C [Bdellovibrionota bacterium]
MKTEELVQFVCSLESRAKRSEKKTDPVCVEIPPDALFSFMEKLRNDPNLLFDFLLSHTAIDWLEEGKFELIYNLTSMKHQHFLMVSCLIPRENPVIPTVSSIWKIAEFQEREVYDFFGVLYDNHPDLRRLFLEDDWEGFPMRKDYKDDFILVPER